MSSESEYEDQIQRKTEKTMKFSKKTRLFGKFLILSYIYQEIHSLILDDYSRIASEVRRYTILYDKSHPDYKKTVLKNEAWKNVAGRVKKLDNKPIDGNKGRTFFNSGKKKLSALINAGKSGSGAESSSKADEREQMLKIFSFLKDHVQTNS